MTTDRLTGRVSTRDDTSQNVLGTLLAQAAASVPQPTSTQARIIEQLHKLETRLAEGHLRIAVLGQFKRGKSSLLNALLGVPAMPTGVTPVTSIPTFIRAGTRNRAFVTIKGQQQELLPGDKQNLADILSDYVSEDANPHNRRGVEHVEVEVATRSLGPGVVAIDTPGVGSMFLHNTQVAEAIIAESDVAVFVVSPDPPITEVEINYLNRIRGLISKIVVVLNKVDLLADAERAAALAFLKRMLREHTNIADETVYCISARRALEAKERNDIPALDASGLPALESHLREVVGSEKRQILLDIVRRRALALISDLRLQTAIELEALRMPLGVLQEKIAAFERSANAFRAEQLSLTDLTAVECRGLLRDLETETDRLWQEAKHVTRNQVRALLSQGTGVEQVQARIGAEIVAHFDNVLHRFIPEFEQRFSDRLAAHKKRADALIDEVRRTAADLMQIDDVNVANVDSLEVEREPYWVEPEAPASLMSISSRAFLRLMPRSIQRRHAENQLFAAIDRAVLRNIANLEWAMRQNIEDAFRRFEQSVGERLTRVLEETLGVMRLTVERHRQRSEEVRENAERCRASLAELDEILSALTSWTIAR